MRFLVREGVPGPRQRGKKRRGGDLGGEGCVELQDDFFFFFLSYSKNRKIRQGERLKKETERKKERHTARNYTPKPDDSPRARRSLISNVVVHSCPTRQNLHHVSFSLEQSTSLT